MVADQDLVSRKEELMSLPDFKVVRADDWGGIYINGELHYEGHSIPDFVWIELLRDYAGVKVDTSDSESPWAYEVIRSVGCPKVWPYEDD